MSVTDSKPLGDIGYNPDDVESRLEEHFHLAQRWGCVMLLDEADVFLAKRTVSHAPGLWISHSHVSSGLLTLNRKMTCNVMPWSQVGVLVQYHYLIRHSQSH